MTTKLTMDISSGTLNVENEEIFRKEVYNDFRTLVATSAGNAKITQPASRQAERAEEPPDRPRRKSIANNSKGEGR